MARCYTVNLTPTAIAVATTDLVELSAADDVPIRIRAIRFWQTSDAGDAQDEVITLNIQRGNTTSGSGGSAFTPIAKSNRDPAATFAAEVGNTTAASAGTAVTVYSTGVNVRAPFEMIFPEDLMPYTDQGGGFLVVRMGAAPADSLTIGCSVDVWEL